MNSSFRQSKCPVCYSTNLKTLRDVSSGEAAQHFILREANPSRNQNLKAHIETLWGGGNCAMRQCQECDFGFSDPYVAGDADFYNLAYERSGYPSDKWDYSRTVEELEVIDFRAERVLEVGSGLGFFLDKLAGRFVPASGITALEYHDNAIRSLHKKGYTAIQADFREVELEPGFDAIFLFQVLEHMDRLDLLFARLNTLLRPGGIAIVSVPNSEQIWFNELNGLLLDNPPNHIGRWSRKSLDLIGARHGLNLDKFEVQPFALSDYIRQDIGSSYLRRTQRPGTLANWSRIRRSRPYGRLVGLMAAAAYAPLRLNAWRRAAKARLGGSYWAMYRKASS